MSKKNPPLRKGISALLGDIPKPGDPWPRQVIESELQYLDLSLITPDPNQPRHYYNESDMQELTDSIREKGVLSPILVRPIEDKYMIVYGERRYRASIAVQTAIATRSTIPAMVRVLTDEEALEIQIIENLQRKDVQPMEEAVAFKSLLDKKQLDIKEIALRVGKSASYVALRIQLNMLTAEFQEMLSREIIDMKTAYKLCRVSPDIQNTVFNEVTQYSPDWREDDDFEIEDIDYLLDDHNNDLSIAPFSLEDPELLNTAGACTSCKFNTANAPLLFEDMQGQICTNSACFAIKKDTSFKKDAEQIMLDPDIFPILPQYFNGADSHKRIAVFKEMNIHVLTFREYEIQHQPARSDYDEGEDETYQIAVSKFNELRNSQDIKRGFMVCGYDAGKIYFIRIKEGVIESAEKDRAGNETNPANAKIQQIKDREIRSKELDNIKVYGQVYKELPLCEDYLVDSSPLTGNTMTAALYFLYNKLSHDQQEPVRKELSLSRFHDVSVYEAMDRIKDPILLLNRLLRLAILGMRGASDVDYKRNGDAFALVKLAEDIMADKLAEILQSQDQKATERQLRVAKRIQEVKNSVDKEDPLLK
jgi:ParB family chromosome partitioning protein